jgi:hypothetical protein
MHRVELPECCACCGESLEEFSVLVYRDKNGFMIKRRFCPSWISPICWAAYEAEAEKVGF